MRISQKIMSVLLLATLSTMAQAADFIEVTKNITVSKSVDEVWKSVGDFCAIKDWHPAVDKCEAYDDHGSFYRKLTLTDGAAILEKKKGGEEANSYTYFIKKGLPVKPYKATFKAEADGTSTKITWTANFKARDVSDEEAKELIEGIFDAGMASLSEKLK